LAESIFDRQQVLVIAQHLLFGAFEPFLDRCAADKGRPDSARSGSVHRFSDSEAGLAHRLGIGSIYQYLWAFIRYSNFFQACC
jgi:hypothetical protein